MISNTELINTIKQEYQKHHKGGCRLISNPDCQCFLCTLDHMHQNIHHYQINTTIHPTIKATKPLIGIRDAATSDLDEPQLFAILTKYIGDCGEPWQQREAIKHIINHLNDTLIKAFYP